MTRPDAPADRRDRVRNLVGIAILVGAFLWAVVHVAWLTFRTTGKTPMGEGKRVVRFVHWQIEGGIVDALDEACRMYEAVHPDVDVQQIAVPERAYYQWVRTQLVGHTAPDLIEYYPGEDNLFVRYFVPVTQTADKPNPYHEKAWIARIEQVLQERQGETPHPKPLDLEGVPWRETFVDGMLGGYSAGLQDQYGMPLSIFTIRCYANKQLLEKAAGTTQPPEHLDAFFRICEDIQAYARRNRLKLVPIAGSKYTDNVFRGRYIDMAKWGLLDVLDLNGDSWVDNSELLDAVFSGRLDFATDPHVRAGHEMMFRISRYFNPGFMAAERDQSVFLFAQGNAAMIATGTWDAGSLYQQVAGDFDILVFDFPIARPDNPEYGPFFQHRLSEAGTRTGFPFNLTKFSQHPDVAVDFMHFLTCRPVNEWLNKRFRWFPATRGAETDDLLRAFEPKMQGIWNIFNMWIGTQTQLRYDQLYGGFISNTSPTPVHYQRFIDKYAAQFKKEAFGDFERAWKDAYAAIVQTEQGLTQIRARAMRQGLTPGLERSLMEQAFGQIRRLEGRAVESWRYRPIKEQYGPEAEPDAGGGKGGGP